MKSVIVDRASCVVVVVCEEDPHAGSNFFTLSFSFLVKTFYVLSSLCNTSSSITTQGGLSFFLVLDSQEGGMNSKNNNNNNSVHLIFSAQLT